MAACKAAAVRIRQLRFHETVFLRVQAQDTLEQSLRRQVGRSHLDGAWAAYQTALYRFGLVPEGFDLAGFRVALNAEQLGGYFVPRSNTVVVVDKPAQEKLSDGAAGAEGAVDADTLRDALLVHEFTHALQHQNLKALKAFRPAGGPLDVYDDGAMARRALVEGDATFVAIQYLLGPGQRLERALDAGRRMAEQVARADAPWLRVMAAGPPALAELVLFPYLAGLDFVARLLRERGWCVVNAAYAAPPVSTEQIRHPSRYLEGDRPAIVSVAGVGDLLERGYRNLADGRWGELGVHLVLRYARGVTETNSWIRGWGGDTFRVLGQGQDWLVVWAVAWDDNRAAMAFQDAWHSGDGGDTTFPASYRLLSRERVTLLLWGSLDIEAAEADALLQSVHVTRSPARPPRPVWMAIETGAYDNP